MAAKKTVCIVGAGPAGLVGAKVLLQTGRFKVTIFEKSNRIGGIWALDQTTSNAWLHPDTPTNLSKFSVGFSDFAWRDELIKKDPAAHSAEGGKSNAVRVPMFPKAWHANAYLEAYRSKHIPFETIKFEHEVVKAVRTADTTDASQKAWHITIKTFTGHESTQIFDHLIVASGFFSKPRSIQYAIPGIESTTLSPSVKIIHSSEYKSLDSILPSDPSPSSPTTILLIGGGNSAGEAGAAIANHLSSAVYSPSTLSCSQRDHLSNYKILHITPRPLYYLPPYHPCPPSTTSTNPSSQTTLTYIPLDLRFYDLSKRPALPAPITAGAGRQPPFLKQLMHDTVRDIMGGDQGTVLTRPTLSVPAEEPRGAVAVALTESYGEFARSGKIESVLGRVVGLDTVSIAGEERVVARIAAVNGDQETVSEPLAAVVCATGFTPGSALEFLDGDVLQALEYDPTSPRLPVILEGWQTMRKDVPELALLGFYEGPYWGIMEMQARYTAARWLGEVEAKVSEYEDAATMRNLREGMRGRELDVPQYWFGDYLGYMEEIASHLKLERNDAPFGEREGCTSPARHLSATDDLEEAKMTMLDLHKTWHACIDEGRYVPRAVFRALQGEWTIRRIIDSKLPTYPSGTLQGTASFHPRKTSSDRSGQIVDLEYLYIESGTLTMSNGVGVNATRRYVYRYTEATDKLSVWFVKPDADLEVDYLFHDLTFISPDDSRSEGACVAKADHLCVEDMYWTEYRFPMKAISLSDFETKHTVNGPQKDYVATTWFARPSSSS